MRKLPAPFPSIFLAAFLGSLVLSCTTVHYPEAYPQVENVIESARQSGLKLVNPFALDDEIRNAADMEIGRWGTPYDRVRRTLRFMNDKGYLNFQYDKDISLTALEAYHTHRGNCMSYTNLFLGIARHLDIPVFFVHINEATSYYERDGTFVVSSHMAIGYDTANARITLVDLTGESDRLRVYERIGDLAAFCLFYNNVAVEQMIDGDLEGAESLLAFLRGILPALRETENNLGALYIRQGRFPDALALFQGMIQRYPDYRPAYTNGLVAARGAGDPAIERTFAVGAENLADKDPFYLFNQGLHRFQDGDYSQAEGFFRKALRVQPENPLIHAWLSRVLLEQARTEEGVEEFRRAQALSPNQRILEEIRQRFPALEAVPLPVKTL